MNKDEKFLKDCEESEVGGRHCGRCSYYMNGSVFYPFDEMKQLIAMVRERDHVITKIRKVLDKDEDQYSADEIMREIKDIWCER